MLIRVFVEHDCAHSTVLAEVYPTYVANAFESFVHF